MNTTGICKFAKDDYGGPCKGPLLELNDNSVGDTVYCEYHARVVTAWAQTHNKKLGPIWNFLNSLGPDGWKWFREKVETVSLNSFIPYVPRPVWRKMDDGSQGEFDWSDITQESLSKPDSDL